MSSASAAAPPGAEQADLPESADVTSGCAAAGCSVVRGVVNLPDSAEVADGAVLPRSASGERARRQGEGEDALEALLGEPERGYRLRVERLRRVEAAGQDELMLSALSRRTLGGRVLHEAREPSAPRSAEPGSLARVAAPRGLERAPRGEGAVAARGVDPAATAGAPFLKTTTRLGSPVAAGQAPGILGGALVGLRWPDAAAWAEITAALHRPKEGEMALGPRSDGPDLERDLLRRRMGGEMALGPRSDGRPAFVVLDTETTGLGGAAGTLAFMIGLAWPEAEGMVIEQWWLQALGGEAGMLRAVAARLSGLRGPQTALLTFNGLSFDLPLLRRRFARHRVDQGALGGSHLDLLPPARRLGRAPGGDARLTTLERAHLGVIREGDVEGSAIPAAFWRWLEAPSDPGASAVISQIHAHNAVDLAVLPALAAALARAAAHTGC
ncbi:MAG: ribonuclease H-like domain-containing protein [Nannocystis sp.]|nr:ribonuclease H-like domain-containing protein [Nannocystis sp.]